MLSLGMPVYVDGAVNPDEDATFSSQTELLAVAEVIGETDKANELIEWRQGWLDFVAERVAAVSYTHLDVYKRQDLHPLCSTWYAEYLYCRILLHFGLCILLRS